MSVEKNVLSLKDINAFHEACLCCSHICRANGCSIHQFFTPNGRSRLTSFMEQDHRITESRNGRGWKDSLRQWKILPKTD